MKTFENLLMKATSSFLVCIIIIIVSIIIISRFTFVSLGAFQPQKQAKFSTNRWPTFYIFLPSLLKDSLGFFSPPPIIFLAPSSPNPFSSLNP